MLASGDSDWWSFESQPGEWTQLTLDFAGTDAIAVWQLVDGAGTPITSDGDVGVHYRVWVANVTNDPVTVYAEIGEWQGFSGACLAYDVTVADRCYPDGYDNNALEDAQTLAAGSMHELRTVGDSLPTHDWWAVDTLNGDIEVFVDYATDHSNVQVRVWSVDSNGVATQETYGTLVPTGRSVTIDATIPGPTAYIEVYESATAPAGTCGAYTIRAVAL